ncbi:MAG: SPOR domain-containing protein [Pseudomonadota bacterium]|jgi:cell division protein FtsN
MSKNLSSRNPPPKKKKSGISSLLAVLLSGMVLGLIVAGAVAWFVMKSPSPFVNKDQAKETTPAEGKDAKAAAKPEAKKAPESGKTVLPPEQAPTPAQAASAPAGDDKPRFEFYKVLTDKQEATVPVKKGATESKPADAVPDKQEYYLQVGSYTSMEEAEKKKAGLAMQGVEARIQTVDLPEKGVRHRVRLGPYKNMEEMNKMRASLKQNGVDSTPMRGQ